MKPENASNIPTLTAQVREPSNSPKTAGTRQACASIRASMRWNNLNKASHRAAFSFHLHIHHTSEGLVFVDADVDDLAHAKDAVHFAGHVVDDGHRFGRERWWGFCIEGLSSSRNRQCQNRQKIADTSRNSRYGGSLGSRLRSIGYCTYK